MKLILNIALILLLQTQLVLAQHIIVSPNGAFQSVQEAIQIASPFDTLLIKTGIYTESDIFVDKPLVIIGENESIIDAETKGFGLIIESDSVTVKGLEIRNTSASFMEDYAGILIEDAQSVLIENVKLRNTYFGIYLAKASNITLKNNSIIAAGKRETSSGNAIHLWNSSDVKIEGNYLSGHRDGLYIEFVKNAEIIENISEKNIRYGIHFMYSDDCSYTRNTFRDNGGGVAVMYTSNVEITGNKFEDNWGSSAYGMLLKEINRSNIQNNEFSGNSTGLYIEASSRNTFTGNTFTSNGWAVKLMANSTDNSFSGNNFIANSFEVSTNSRQHFNEFNGNYWSQYKGYDLDKDGIGDVPHRPVRLFSILIEKQPQALLLLQSVLVDILDAAENFMPSLTPETLIDSQPLMAEKL